MENLQPRIDFLNALTLENYIDYCREFLTKRGYPVNEDNIYVQFRINHKLPNLKSNGITMFNYRYDNGTDKVVSLQIDYKGIELEDLVNNKMLEKYEFPQAQLLINVFFNR